MSVTVPTPQQLKEVAGQVGLSLTDGDIASFIALMQPNIEAYNVVDRLPDRLPPVKYPRTPGYRPKPEENERNAWMLQVANRRSRQRQAQGQDGGHQGQRDGRRRADDEAGHRRSRATRPRSTRPS